MADSTLFDLLNSLQTARAFQNTNVPQAVPTQAATMKEPGSIDATGLSPQNTGANVLSALMRQGPATEKLQFQPGMFDWSNTIGFKDMLPTLNTAQSIINERNRATLQDIELKSALAKRADELAGGPDARAYDRQAKLQESSQKAQDLRQERYLAAQERMWNARLDKAQKAAEAAAGVAASKAAIKEANDTAGDLTKTYDKIHQKVLDQSVKWVKGERMEAAPSMESMLQDANAYLNLREHYNTFGKVLSSKLPKQPVYNVEFQMSDNLLFPDEYKIVPLSPEMLLRAQTLRAQGLDDPTVIAQLIKEQKQRMGTAGGASGDF